MIGCKSVKEIEIRGKLERNGFLKSLQKFDKIISCDYTIYTLNFMCIFISL